MFYDVFGNQIDFQEDSGGGTDPLQLYRGYTMEIPPAWTPSTMIAMDDNSFADGAAVSASGSLNASEFVPVRGRNTLQITIPVDTSATPVNYGLAFYDENQSVIPRYGANAFFDRASGGALYRIAEVFVPENAAFFRTTFWSDSAAFTYTFTAGDNRLTRITHELPANKGVENAVRKARQITDIEYTPRVDIPRYCLMNGSDVHFIDWFKAGEKAKGIPYSGSGRTNHWTYGRIDPAVRAGQWGYYMFFVGLEVSFETFVTAARYPNSILGERAAPDATFNEADVSIYGDVCSALVSYALGLKSPIWPIPQFMSSASYGKNWFKALGALGTGIQLADIRLGDVFHNNTHIAIITDIIRDETGVITFVEISEATTIGNANNEAHHDELGGKCRRKTWPAGELIVSYWATDYLMYRFKAFTGNGYTKSEFVDTGDEGDCQPIVDLPCIPYLGNKARYKAGYIVNSDILIGASGFTTLVVTRNGQAFNSFQISGLSKISVGFSIRGSYEAHLTGPNGMTSRSCYWTVE